MSKVGKGKFSGKSKASKRAPKRDAAQAGTAPRRGESPMAPSK